jgi:hypothetical protein
MCCCCCAHPERLDCDGRPVGDDLGRDVADLVTVKRPWRGSCGRHRQQRENSHDVQPGFLMPLPR